MWQSYFLLLIWCNGFYADAIIPTPPLITKQAEGVIVFQVAMKSYEADKPFIILCEAEGEPEPTYQWTKNGQPFEWQVYDDRMMQQHRRGSLVITNPRDEDIGQYQCFASNEFGTATSNPVFVRKTELNSFKEENVSTSKLPFFTIEPEHVTAEEGEDATFYCEAQGNPEPSINWIFNGRPIAEASVNNRRVVTTNSITIKGLLRSDTGNYGCNATNNLGYVYRDVYLNVPAI